LVSIVVPCYNVEDYVEECIGSAAGQTYADVEIIAVDDGSTDETGAKLETWEASVGSMRLIRQPNAGLGAARNAGIAHATGEYLFFLDGDDLLSEGALAAMVTMAERTGSDLVTGAVERFDNQRSWRSPMHRRGFDSDRERVHIFDVPDLLRDHIVCSKLFRRQFWDDGGFHFPEGVLFEDMELATLAHVRAETVDIIGTTCYRWRSREGASVSITQDRVRAGGVSARFDALSRIQRQLDLEAPASLRRAHVAKVFDTDLPLYLQYVGSGTERFDEEFGTAASRLGSAVARYGDGLSRRDRLRARALREGDSATIAVLARVVRSRYPLLTALRAAPSLTWRDRSDLAIIELRAAVGRSWRAMRGRAVALRR
jgi:CDP-glycerol glycerophosphotransferase